MGEALTAVHRGVTMAGISGVAVGEKWSSLSCVLMAEQTGHAGRLKVYKVESVKCPLPHSCSKGLSVNSMEYQCFNP